jgi:protease I
LTGKRVAILVAEGFQDQETLDPMNFLRDRGAEVVVIGPSVKTVTAYNSDKQVQIEKAVADVTASEFDALIIPGGHSPQRLRDEAEIVDFVRAFYETDRTIAAICHGPQVLIAAGVMDGKRATGYEGISDELIEAGADYKDRPLVHDGNIITSRVPDDLPVFSEAIANALSEGLDLTEPLTPPSPLAPGAPVSNQTDK